MKSLVILLILILICPCAANATASGWVIGWGYDANGQATGVAFRSYTNGVVTINGEILTNAVAIAAGQGHGLALRSDGIVVGWGLNDYRQATGSSDRASGVVMVGGQTLNHISAITTGKQSGFALKDDGTVAAWGEDNYGYLKSSEALSNVVSIAGWYGMAVKKDGSVANIRTGETVDGLSNMVAVAIRGGNVPASFGLQKNGTVITWGNETTYGDATPPAGLSNVVAISAGLGYTLALKKDGTVVGWGFNRNGEATGTPSTGSIYVTNGPVMVRGQALSKVVAVAVGNSHSLALRNDGTVVSWGYSPLNRLDVPAGLSNVVAIAAGDNFCLAITTNRAVAEKFQH